MAKSARSACSVSGRVIRECQREYGVWLYQIAVDGFVSGDACGETDQKLRFGLGASAPARVELESGLAHYVDADASYVQARVKTLPCRGVEIDDAYLGDEPFAANAARSTAGKVPVSWRSR